MLARSTPPNGGVLHRRYSYDVSQRRQNSVCARLHKTVRFRELKNRGKVSAHLFGGFRVSMAEWVHCETVAPPTAPSVTSRQRELRAKLPQRVELRTLSQISGKGGKRKLLLSPATEIDPKRSPTVKLQPVGSLAGSLDTALHWMNSSTKRANSSGCSQCTKCPAPCSVISSKPVAKNFSCRSNISGPMQPSSAPWITRTGV